MHCEIGDPRSPASGFVGFPDMVAGPSVVFGIGSSSVCEEYKLVSPLETEQNITNPAVDRYAPWISIFGFPEAQISPLKIDIFPGEPETLANPASLEGKRDCNWSDGRVIRI